MQINSMEFTIMVNQGLRALKKDKRPITAILEECGHTDGNATELLNKLMETECRLYLTGLCLLFQHDLFDIYEPYDYISSFSIILNGEKNEKKMQK